MPYGGGEKKDYSGLTLGNSPFNNVRKGLKIGGHFRAKICCSHARETQQGLVGMDILPEKTTYYSGTHNFQVF